MRRILIGLNRILLCLNNSSQPDYQVIVGLSYLFQDICENVKLLK